MQRITRLAPSPTGALHLGNARTFVANWLLAKQAGASIVLRIEDIDGPRIKPGSESQLIDDLRWLGLDWDAGPIRQSDRRQIYADAVEKLLQAGAAYPCICSRKEAESAASAPHLEDGASVYPGTCRGRYATVAAAEAASGRRAAVRFAVDAAPIEFSDHFSGPHRWDDPARRLGDFVIEKADRTPAYQLAVVVDDAAAAVTDVVRGDDLLESAARQILIYRALGLADKIPAYTHLPLVLGPDGRRLAKRHGDTRLSFYRAAGVPAGRVLSLVAGWLGVEDAPETISLTDLLASFDLNRVPRGPITFSAEDDAFLRGAATGGG